MRSSIALRCIAHVDHMLTYCAAALLALAFRFACLGSMRPTLKLGLHLISGVWLGVASWTVGALVQAWVPLWQTLLIGLTLSAIIAALRVDLAVRARAVVDFVAVSALGPLSVIPVRFTSVIGAAIVFAAAGLALDRLSRPMPPVIPWRLFALPGILLVLLAINVRYMSDFGSRLFVQEPLVLMRSALALPDPGERIHFDSGTAAWILRVPSDHPRGTAILLHGSHPLASRQPAAVSMQGALLRAGYDVLSVDHPGYGATSIPNADADWRAWDPSIGPERALRYLRSTKSARGPEMIVVGHSVGVDVALLLLRDEVDVQAAYLFGGSLDRPLEPENDWIRMFHRQRSMPCCLPLEKMRMIREQFYSGADRYAIALPQLHAVVHFVRFGIEYPDVARDRELLYAAITAPKRVCDFKGVTHYFNAASLRRLALIDTLAVKRTAEIVLSSEKADNACGG
jgi:pimeloyl-ACP methyl ester carboxylesterase